MDGSDNIYDNINDDSMSPHDTNGFAFSAFDSETFVDVDQSFAEPLSSSTSPFQYAMPYDMEVGAEASLPSPQTNNHSPASTGAVDMMGVGLLGVAEPQMPVVSAHIRSNPGSFSSVATSATAVSQMATGMAGLDMDGPLIKQELSPGPNMGHVTPPMDTAVLATMPGAPVETAPAAAAPAAPTPKAPAKRKRENRYKNAPPAVLSRRRAQNRASQRAYRERKDQRIRDLEAELTAARSENETCKRQMATMQREIMTRRVGSTLAATNGPGPNHPPRAMSMSAMPPQMQMLHNGQMVRMQQMPLNMMNHPGMVPMQHGFPMNPQEMHSQGIHPQGISMPPQGIPPQGIPQQGMPPPQGMPPNQGMPPHQGMPPNQGPSPDDFNM